MTMLIPLIWMALARPAAASVEKLPPCPGVRLLRTAGAPPFHTGEELGYELSVAGVYVGRLDLKVGAPRAVGEQKAMTLFGRARTNSFASQFKPFTGRWMSLLELATLRPLAMRVEARYGEDPRWERASFDGEARGVKTEFLYQGAEGARSYERREATMFDLLSALYYARTRVLEPGPETCQEVYVDKRVWRMDAKVLGVENVETPAGPRRAIRAETKLERVPHPDFDPKHKRPSMRMDIFFSADDNRVPLAFVITTDQVTGRGDLVSWSLRGREGEASWEF